MDYANERWIKVYTRDTAGWLAMSWQAQALGILLSRKMEATTGEISLGRKGLPAVIGLLGPTARWQEVEPFIRELLEEGRLEYDDERKVLVDREHPVRQGTVTAAAVRKRAQRERERDPVTPCHTTSRDIVTPSHDQREETEQKDEREQTRARTHEGEPMPDETPAPEPAPPPVVHRDVKPENVLDGLMPTWAENQLEAICAPNLVAPEEVGGILVWQKYTASRERERKPLSEPDFRGFCVTWVANWKERQCENRSRRQAEERARDKPVQGQHAPPPMTRRVLSAEDAKKFADQAAAAALGGT